MEKNIIVLSISALLAKYTNIEDVLLAFLIITLIDTLTGIHATAVEKGLKFNPFSLAFYKHINSAGLRQMSKKVFGEYFVWLIVVFIVDHLVLKSAFKIPFFGNDLFLPIALLYFFIFIEIRSIGENIGRSGRINWLIELVKFLPKDLKNIYTKLNKVYENNKNVPKGK